VRCCNVMQTVDRSVKPHQLITFCRLMITITRGSKTLGGVTTVVLDSATSPFHCLKVNSSLIYGYVINFSVISDALFYCLCFFVNNNLYNIVLLLIILLSTCIVDCCIIILFNFFNVTTIGRQAYVKPAIICTIFLLSVKTYFMYYIRIIGI